MFQAYSFRDGPLQPISITVFLSTLLSQTRADSLGHWVLES